MGRLGGFSYRDVITKLLKLGFEFYRQAKGSHEIYKNIQKNSYAVVPKHKEIKEGTLKAILKQAEIDIDEFLEV